MSGRPRTPSGASAPPTLDTRPSGYQHRKSLSTSSAGSGGPGGVGAPSSPRPEVRRARALWDYHAIEGNELSFKAGAIISIIELCNDDWYEGQVGDKCGFFPANRVELLKRDITKQPPVGGIRIPSPTPGSPSSSGTPARQNSQSRPTSPLKTAFAAPAISEMSPVATTSSSQFAVDMRSPSPARSEVNPFGDDAAISDSSMSEGLSQGVRERVRDTSQATKPANRFGKSDWETVINTQGQAYFWNRNTGETSWGSPVTSASQRSQSPQMQPLDLNQGSLATAAAERAQSVHRRNTSGSVKGDLLTDLAKVIDRFDSTSVVSQPPSLTGISPAARGNNRSAPSPLPAQQNPFSYPAIPTYTAQQQQQPVEGSSPPPPSAGGSAPSPASPIPPPPPQPPVMRFVDEIDSDLPPADAETMAFSNITSVPPEIIRREGWLAAKLKSRESASNNALNASGPGNAPLSPVASSKVSKRLESWRTMWTVLCVGFLIFFKEDPAKSKRACKPVRVIHLNKVTLEAVGKSHTKKKNAFSLVPDRGATWLLQPNTESEVFDWMDAIKEASRERSTANEYENSSSKLLATPPLDGSVDLPELPRVASKNVKEETRQTRTRRATTSKSIPTEPLDDFEGRKSNVKSKLGAFFSKRPTVERLKEKGILRDEDQIFGGHLATQVRPGAPPGDNIPVVVRMCVKEVDERGLTSQGIYRLSGNASTVQKIRVQFNQQEHVNLSDESLDINAVASVLKLYFRELQDPLIPFAFYNNFIAAAKVEDYDTRLINVKTLIQSLPRPNYDTLEFLMRHLSRVSARSDVNKMEPSNLAIVFGPTLVRMPDEGQTAYLNMLNMTYHNSLMEGVLVQTEWIFDGSTS